MGTVMARRNFGSTWWGRAWVDALEGRAQIDPNRLPRGRTYARKGQVGALEVTAGQIKARVQGSRPVPYRVTIGTHRFSARDWETLLDTIGGQMGYTAALLDGELPPELAEHARSAGVDLLPGPGDLWPRCSCPDSADPCKHAAAVCYLVADEVDADPFVLFLLRGKGRDELLAELRARRARPPGAEAALDEGVEPEDAFARTPGALPALPPIPEGPARPLPLPSDPPPGSALRTDVLTDLATNAATVAWHALTDGPGEVFGLSLEEDLARRAAIMPDVTVLAAHAGMPVKELTRWAIAWREAGRGGLNVLREIWQPPRGKTAEARAELDEADLPGETVVWRNRVTRGDVQLRLGRDGRWYRFARRSLGWVPSGPGSVHPVDVLS
ncbi:SWIM zinc finger family protein [Amycolatopsis pigmentata]|uniref:SWIM zinc finger family protein n=1 Tax=Amycolatopsis pigmentata TaxID=450801 RepID=A0ABW5FV20_9PSEU